MKKTTKISRLGLMAAASLLVATSDAHASWPGWNGYEIFQGSSATFNNNYHFTDGIYIDDYATATFGTSATDIYSNVWVYGSTDDGARTINFKGNNKLFSSIYILSPGDIYDNVINVEGAVSFIGGTSGEAVYADKLSFASQGSLTSNILIAADVDFNGNDAVLNFETGSSVYGNIYGSTSGNTVGIINFRGSDAYVNGDVETKEINLGSASGSSAIRGYTYTNNVNFTAAATIAFGQGLDTRDYVSGAMGTLSFGRHNGLVLVGDSSNSSYWDFYANISITGTAPTGTLQFVSGYGDVYGTVGSSTAKLSQIILGNVGSGSAYTNVYARSSDATFHTDVYADQIWFNNLNGTNAANSALRMTSGKNIYGDGIYSNQNSYGEIYLEGGTQSINYSTIGSGSYRLGGIISGLASGDVSTIKANTVYTYSSYTGDGITNFEHSINSTNYTVVGGTVNFNTSSSSPGTATFGSNIGTNSYGFAFSGNGIANFNQGLTGDIDFYGNAGTVNIAAGKDAVGSIYNTVTTSQHYGVVNFAGGTSAITGSVNAISALNIGYTASNGTTASGPVGAISEGVLSVGGSIDAQTIKLWSSTATAPSTAGSFLIAGGNITGDVITNVNNKGTLELNETYTQTVNGTIGSSNASLKLVEAGNSNLYGTNGGTYFNGMVYANKLLYTGNGYVELTGTNGINSAASGIKGTVDFDNQDGLLGIGDGIDLTFGTTATVFDNANNASLFFLGSSTVTGNVGAAWSGSNPASSTVRDIFAGANLGDTVTFNGKVYVSATTFHVSGLGTVNFNDDLVGPLNFQDDGEVHFAHNKGVVHKITAGDGFVTTDVDNEGKLYYAGSTVLDGTIGDATHRLKIVNFHNSTAPASANVSLGYNIYSVDTVIGNSGSSGTTPTTTVATITDHIHLGTYVALADDSTTLFTSGAQRLTLRCDSVTDSFVDFNHTKNADGRLSLPTGAITQSSFDNLLTTANGTLGFAISTQSYISSPATIDVGASSRITGGAGSALNMSGSENIQVALLGSVKDGETYTLINVDGAPPGTGPWNYGITDNSFTIDTTLSRDVSNSSLVLTASRNAQTYLTKSGTQSLGLRSYDMALRLGTLAAAGTGYSASLQTVFNKLDIDQWGYACCEKDLAHQLYLLTPSGDGAAVKAATGLTAQAVGAVLDGSNSLSTRATPQRSYWVRAYGSHDNQSGSGEFAGYNINGGGVTVGTDYSIGDSVVGVAVGYGKAKATSRGARDGDTADVDSTIAGLFFRTPIGQYFLNAMIDGAKHRTKTDRQTAVGERANGDYTGTEFGGAIQLGRKFVLSDKNESLTPILSVNYSRYKQEAYAETGAGDIGLSYTEQRYTQSDARLSLRYAVEKSLGEGVASSFSAALGYKHLLSRPTYNNTVAFVGDAAGGSYDMYGFNETHKGSLTASLAYNYNPSKGVTYTIDYSGEVKSGYNAHSLGFRATWEY